MTAAAASTKLSISQQIYSSLARLDTISQMLLRSATIYSKYSKLVAMEKEAVAETHENRRPALEQQWKNDSTINIERTSQKQSIRNKVKAGVKDNAGKQRTVREKSDFSPRASENIRSYNFLSQLLNSTRRTV